MRTASVGGGHRNCEGTTKGSVLIKGTRWPRLRALLLVLALVYVTPRAWGQSISYQAFDTPYVTGWVQAERLSDTSARCVGQWTSKNWDCYMRVDPPSQPTDPWQEGYSCGNGVIGSTYYFTNQVAYSGTRTAMVSWSFSSYRGSCCGSDSISVGINPVAAPACTNGLTQAEVWVGMPWYMVQRNGQWEYLLYGKPPAGGNVALSEGVTQDDQGELLGRWTWQVCSNGVWVARTNAFSRVVGAMITEKQCPDGTWQTARQVTGYTVANQVLSWTLGTQVVNTVSCGQIAAASVGLAWTNLSAGEQALWTNAVGGVVGTGVTSNSVGVGDLGGLGNINTTNRTGALVNRTGGIGVDVNNLSDLATAVSQGVSNGLASAMGGSGGTNGVGDFVGPSLDGYGTNGTGSVSVAWTGSISNLVESTIFTAVLTGATQFASIGRLDSYSFPELSLGGDRKITLSINFQSGLGVGITIFRTGLLIGVIVLFWGVATKTVREGIS